jgi:hypothetical protein
MGDQLRTIIDSVTPDRSIAPAILVRAGILDAGVLDTPALASLGLPA